MLQEAFHWYLARMGELVPAALVRSKGVQADAVIVAMESDTALEPMLLIRRDGRERIVGRLNEATSPGRGRRSVRLRPPPGAVLTQRLILPMAAERSLRDVVAYEINRVTPFEPHDLFWTCSITARDRARGRLAVRLALLPKASVAALLTRLGEANLRAEAIEGAVDILPMEGDRGQPGWRKRNVRVLAVICFVLAAGAVVVPFLQQALALRTVEKQIAALQPDVSQVQALRQRLAREAAGHDAVDQQRMRYGDPLQVIASVTNLLPDDTFLRDFSLQQRRLTLSGESASAPRLIAALAADPGFRDPGFAAPVSRNEGSHADIFSIRTEVAP